MKTTLWLKLKTPLLGCCGLLAAVIATWAVGTTALKAAGPLDKPVAAKSDVAVPDPAATPSAQPGLVSAIAGGREVSVTAAETSASIHVVGPNAEVKVGPQLLIVEKSQLVLDGQPLAELPPGTKKVEVSLDKGMLSVKGDGKEIARAKMGADILPGTPPLQP